MIIINIITVITIIITIITVININPITGSCFGVLLLHLICYRTFHFLVDTRQITIEII